MDELQAVEAWLSPILQRLGAGERRALMTAIGRDLRRGQQARMKRQENPDGSAFEPRRPRAARAKGLREKAGRIKREAMFRKLRTAKYLKVEATAEGLAIGFSGRAAYVARVHQEGLSERVAKDGPQYQYPQRKLLGFTDQEREQIIDQVLAHLVK